MSGPSAATSRPQRAGSGRLPLVPKEHGASFMAVHALLLGSVAGFVSGGRSLGGLALALAFGILFLPLTAAVSAFTHRTLAGRARRRGLELAAALAGIGAAALWHGPARQLLILAGVGSALAVVYAACRIRTGPRSTQTELAAIGGISLLAPLTWLLIGGPRAGWLLAGPACLLAFGGTVPYVRERVHRRRRRDARLPERLRAGAIALGWQGLTLLAALGAVAAGWVHPLVLLAFSLGAVKTAIGIATPESAPPMRRLGYVETAVSTAFAILAGIGLGMAR